MRVLIIDDEEDDFILTRDALRESQEGELELRWIADFETAQKAICQDEFDVVLLDYYLGAHTGLELLVYARQQLCKTPIILLTRWKDRTVDLAGMQAGAVDFLCKSELRPQELERAIRYAIERARLQLERDRESERLLDEYQRLQQVERVSSIGLLASSVAHEINNPLCGTIGLARALGERSMPEGQFREYLATLQDGLERMRGTMEGLLALVRGRSLPIARVDAADVIAACIRLGNSEARARQVAVLVSTVPPQALLSANFASLILVILNLFLNAVHATPPGGTVGLSVTEDPRRIGLCVKDSGAGLPKEVLTRLREPFLTVRSTGTDISLGLLLSNSIIKANKGEIDFMSEPERGTTITVWLPKAPSESAPL